MRKDFSARKIIGGTASGRALVSRVAFTFAHGVDPKTGKITDLHSDLKGKNVRKRILFYPYGKGSTTASAWLLETVRLGNAPAAIVTATLDPSVVTGSAIAQVLYGKPIPVLVWPKMHGNVKSGDYVLVEKTGEKVVLFKT
jgi:predicted aconitase with swiveling domain